MESTPGYQPVTQVWIDYSLRSSVLGGRVITELNDLGQKRKTNVYVGNEVAAEQGLYGETPAVFWKYSNPITATTAEQTSYGVTKKDYDPFGLELGQSDPYLASAEPDYPSITAGSLYRNGGNPFDPEQGCQWNGAPHPCGGLGLVLRAHEVEHIQVISRDPAFAARLRAYTVRNVVRSRVLDEHGAVISPWSLGVTSAHISGLPGSQDPQNSYSEVYGQVTAVLRGSKCAQFASDILSVVSQKKSMYPDKGTLLDVFFEFLKQPSPNDLFTRQLPDGSLGYGNAIGNIRKGTAQIALPGFPNADGMIGELFHLAARNGTYSDKHLAQAVRKFPQYAEVANKALEPNVNIYDKGYQAPTDWTEANQGGYSAYFHYAQYNICFTGGPNDGMKRLLR